MANYTYVSASGTNANVIKSSAGVINGIQVYNTNASARWLKIFSLGSTPSVGSSIPVLNLMIPGNTAGAGNNVPINVNIELDGGISFAITGGAPLLDNTAISANDVQLNVQYQ